MNIDSKALIKKFVFPLLSIIVTIALIPLVWRFQTTIDSFLLWLIDWPKQDVLLTSSLPRITSLLPISLLFTSPLWVLGIWRIVIPNCKLKLTSFCLSLFSIALAVLFTFYVYIPPIINFIMSNAVDALALSSDLLRDFIVKSVLAFILLFQVVPITLHFSKNYDRPFLMSVLIRLALFTAVLIAAAVLAPPDILSQLSMVLSTMLLFELARCVRRYFVIDNGQLCKTIDQSK